MQAKHQQTGVNSENSLPAPTNTSFRINSSQDVVQDEDLNREMKMKMTTNPVKAPAVISAKSPI